MSPRRHIGNEGEGSSVASLFVIQGADQGKRFELSDRPMALGRDGSNPIRLHDNVWIGFDVCVLPGVTIGEGSIVGARSVVNADVPAYTIVAGNPARVIRELPREPAP